ncbi:MAG TPA: alkaline phosphatase [Saprospiraceae bacterium]|nr:alkaline phosphatase [Saprospiraceae bacterium]HMQ84171.1 alkaline phosphatase [Saprospiraceae bacterium]
MIRSLLWIALLGLGACNTYTTGVESSTLKKKPKNIILMIGDGMGLTQITAGLYRNGNKLHLEAFPVVGLHKSYSGSDLITDSAAGATAFACGVKSYNSAIGVDMDTMPVKTILEIAEALGMASGLVATSTITHATPASFIAHVKDRDMHEAIALDFLKTDIDLIIGGGKKFFDRRATDDRNLYAEMEQRGYYVSDYFKENLADIKADPTKNLAYFTADDDPLSKSSGRDYLPEAARFAVNFLSQKAGKEGFFLMIEGSQIDWGGHANNSEYIISETIDFDQAIGQILDFAKRDGETLVIVTADHETGGYAINPGSTQDSIVAGFTSKYHTAALIPVFAYGPGAELFSGIFENTAIFDRMREILD